MKHFTKTVFVTLLLLSITSVGLFAAGVKEGTSETATVKQKVDFSTLDLETASVQTIIDSYQSELDTYDQKYESIYNKMVESYKEGNVDDYFDAKGMLRNLSRPEITAEQTEVLENRIINEKDQNAKDELASWLFANSRYYHPTLTFTTKNEASEDARSRFNYRFQVSSEPGSTVQLPTMRSNFTSDGIFAGWGTEDGEVLYEAGTEITMPYADQTLYAVYKSGVMFIDSVTGVQQFEDGASISAPKLTAPDDTYVFDGWYDSEGNKADGSATLDAGESKVYTAAWKSILIEEVATKHYRGLEIPSGKEVSLNFSLYNQGSVNPGKLTVTLVTENEDALKNKTGELQTSGIRAGAEKSGSFTIVAKGNSGDVINANIVVTDADGNSWSTPVTLKIK